MGAAALAALPLLGKIVLAGIAAMVLYGGVRIIGNARENKMRRKKEKRRAKGAKRKRAVSSRGRPTPSRLRKRKRRS